MTLSREDAQRIMDNANEPIWLRQDAAAILAAYQRQADEQAAAARAQHIAALKRRIAAAEWGPRATLECTIRGVRYRQARPGETPVAWIDYPEEGLYRTGLVRHNAPPAPPSLVDHIRVEIAAPLEARIAALETLTTPAALSRALAEYQRRHEGKP